MSLDEARRFETAVQQWLESLPGSAAQVPRKDTRFWNALNSYIRPAVETGQIRAAAPRSYRKRWQQLLKPKLGERSARLSDTYWPQRCFTVLMIHG